MKKPLVLFLAILFLASCGMESMNEMQPDQEIGENSSDDLLGEEIGKFDLFARLGPEKKINVCKFDSEIGDWVVINVNANAWPALEAQGAVQLIDEDGDGYVTNVNQCGFPVDCDDMDPELTDNCTPSVFNPITGKTWMDRNLGAIRVAESSTDPMAYGDLYQWGRGTDGHQIRTSGTTTTLSSSDQPGHGDFFISNTNIFNWQSPHNNNLWQGVNGVNNPCPCGYRLPTWAEWEEERNSWVSNDAVGALNSPLKLPVAGNREYGSGFVIDVGRYGLYWSSTFQNPVNENAAAIFFYSSSAGRVGPQKINGASVRCIKD